MNFILTQVAAVLTDGDTADSDAFIAQVESIINAMDLADISV